MISIDEAQRLIGSDAVGSDGSKLGRISQVYLDNDTGQPEWITVRTGLLGTRETFVPLAQAQLADGGVTVPYAKDRVKDAPSVEADGQLSPEEEQQLYAYYGLDATSGGDIPTGRQGDMVAGTTPGQAADAGLTSTNTTGTAGTYDTGTYDTGTTGTVGTGTTGRAGTDGYDTSGPTTDDAMTRSEQRVRAGTERTEAGRARLRKHVVTHTEQVEVPVSHEEVRLEREPITEANRGAALDGPELSEEEHEIVLNEERPVVQKETVPVERVRLGKEQVQDSETVNVDVAEERIDTDVDGNVRRDR